LIIDDEELDYVLPEVHFNDKPNISWWWVNIRPITMEENRRKGSSVDYNLFKEQLNKAVAFLNFYLNIDLNTVSKVTNY
jgi:hypothetical protein